MKRFASLCCVVGWRKEEYFDFKKTTKMPGPFVKTLSPKHFAAQTLPAN